MTEQQIENVAEQAEALGYRGTDASAVISLAEYGFLARKATPFVDGSEDSWDVLVYVPEGYPGGPGFKFVSLDATEYDLWDISDELHELRYPGSYVDEPSSAEKTLKLLRCYHDPDAEAKASEARAVLAYEADLIRSHMSRSRPIPPHLTDQVHVAEFASKHQDPVVLLTQEREAGSERRRKTARTLLHSVERKWRKVAMQHGVCIPGEPIEEWEYRF